MKYIEEFDVIVIGGGHAGVEAALAASRIGAKTLLLTHSIDTIGQMSCNPAIGGIGKGHLVKEIDALGGAMAEAIDKAGIQFRILNIRKGPAVRATRAQADRVLYRKAIQEIVQNQENLKVFQQAVDDLVINNNNEVEGIITQTGIQFYAKAVVLTAGTFLDGKIHIGDKKSSGGRAGDQPSIKLAERLRALPFRIGRLKTGTPPRIDARTLDYAAFLEQPGDFPSPRFSFWENYQHPQQVNCHITYTNETTHKIIRDNLAKSAMYSGNIVGVGPRYCPSIEDKVVRFSDKDKHQIFVEPEGLSSLEIYPNGISTSLPFDVQVQFVRSIKGFENAHITRAGYAIEYDYFDPRDLSPTLETKIIGKLFFAGQINGTTGYEEAAAQGVLAGINAANSALGKTSWYPKRSEAYLGVLVDDLITLGTQEPYRMFTSRAEYRLLLREDNADIRLTPIGRELRVINESKWKKFVAKQSAVAVKKKELEKIIVHPNTTSSSLIEEALSKKLEREYSALDLLKRPEITYEFLRSSINLQGIQDLKQEKQDLKKDTNPNALPRVDPIVEPNALQIDAKDNVITEQLDFSEINSDYATYDHLDSHIQELVHEQIEVQVKYAGYIARQSDEIARQSKYENMQIPQSFNFDIISGLSNEVKEKLKRHRPNTIGQASRIAGVTHAAISLLVVSLKKFTVSVCE